MNQIDEYSTFCDLGEGKPPPRSDHKRIRVHFDFNVKYDLRHKARLMAGGYMTKPSKDSVYSGVIIL
jgi:hypothetical protein